MYSTRSNAGQTKQGFTDAEDTLLNKSITPRSPTATIDTVESMWEKCQSNPGLSHQLGGQEPCHSRDPSCYTILSDEAIKDLENQTVINLTDGMDVDGGGLKEF